MMRRLLLSGALVALLSAAAVIDAAERLGPESDSSPMAGPAKPQFQLFSMLPDHQLFNVIKGELDPKLSFRRKIDSATEEAYWILKRCFKDAVLLESYVKQRRDAREEGSGPSSSYESGEGGAMETADGNQREFHPPINDEAWGIFDFPFQPGGEDLSYIEDIAWAVKSVIDVYDDTPLCKQVIKEREGWFMRRSRKITGQSLKDIVTAFLSISLHKALFDWAVLHNKLGIFTGEEIPSLVATAREGIQKRRKLKKLDGQLKSEARRAWMVSRLKAIVANQYLGNLGRASELIRWQLWKKRRAPRHKRQSGQAPSGIEVSETPGSPRQGTSDQIDEDDARELKQVRTFLVSARLFLIMVDSKFVYIGKMISDTAEAIGNEVIGNDEEGHRVLETLPCPANDEGDMVDPSGKKLSKIRFNPTVWVYRFHGIPKAERPLSQQGVNDVDDSSSRQELEEGEEPVSTRHTINRGALDELVNVLAERDELTLRKMFRDIADGRSIQRRDITEAVRPMFPTQCFRNKQDAVSYWAAHGPFAITKDEVPHHFTEMKLSEMKQYEKIMRSHLRGDQEKIKKDVVAKVSKKMAVKQFFKGAVGSIVLLAAVGVALIGLACVIGVGVAATPVVSLPGCALAALAFGPVTLAVTPTLSLAAILLGGFFFAYSTIASIKSALKFVITPIVMNERENYYIAKQMELRELQRREMERQEMERQEREWARQERERAMQLQEMERRRIEQQRVEQWKPDGTVDDDQLFASARPDTADEKRD